ncbi:GNAT family N-acetyltransferase [Arthrobacter sp. NEB 688]|uniref:GNAT family N-acetyltransferase n=1 Tax=Arthrobacter sp. NEB 688 TaxID=904039 RepID=UPI0015673E82|nr:GNAT family N-acetyltransferase [Arthrobacter sp. NEB 688]QKE84364.1 N-acetyltransferase [Arthrobacter sp. NEB 688]
MTEPEIRSATADDLRGMVAIYNEAVRHTVSTFDLETRPDDHYAGHVASTRPGDHVLVAVAPDGGVLGYAYSGTYRPRAAYDGTREVSVYLAEAARGKGLGKRLYDELLRRVDADGVHTCVAVIAQPNPASAALHRAHGFEHVGTLREVGFKLGRRVDTAFWQRPHPDGR